MLRRCSQNAKDLSRSTEHIPLRPSFRREMMFIAIGIVCVAIVTAILLRSYDPLVLASGFTLSALGFVIMIQGTMLYVREYKLKWKIAAGALLALVALGICLVLVLLPLFRNNVFESCLSTEYVEMPRPGIDVIIGGDKVTLQNYTFNTGFSATISMYLGDNLAVALAHGDRDVERMTIVRVADAIIPHATVIANTKAGTILKGIPSPEDREVFPLGGTADITLGARAVIYPPDRAPFEVTVQGFGKIGDLLHVSLRSDRFDERGRRGWSGAPLVQNGVIIAFVSYGPVTESEYFAIVAPELYEELRPYLTPDH